MSRSAEALAAIVAALSLVAAPVMAEDRWIARFAKAQAYIGLSPYRTDLAVYFEADGTTWRNVVWEADNMTIAQLGTMGCVGARDAVRGTIRGRTCPAQVRVSVLKRDGGDLLFSLERVDRIGAPGTRFAR